MEKFLHCLKGRKRRDNVAQTVFCSYCSNFSKLSKIV